MKEIKIQRLSLGGHLKYSVLTGLSCGIVFGIIGFITGIFGGNVTANIGMSQYSGFMAGTMLLILGPLNLTILSLIFGLLSFLPLRLFLKIKNGISLKYKPVIKEEDHSAYLNNELEESSETDIENEK